jgi:hypothetical protein
VLSSTLIIRAYKILRGGGSVFATPFTRLSHGVGWRLATIGLVRSNWTSCASFSALSVE